MQKGLGFLKDELSQKYGIEHAYVLTMSCYTNASKYEGLSM